MDLQINGIVFMLQRTLGELPAQIMALYIQQKVNSDLRAELLHDERIPGTFASAFPYIVANI